MRILKYALAATACLFAFSTFAHADELVTVAGAAGTFVFDLPSATPAVALSSAGNYFDTIPTTGTSPYTQLGFGSSSYFAGQLGLVDIAGGTQLDFFDLAGGQYYTGTEAAPTLIAGVYSAVNLQDSTNYTITIGTIAATPEPSSFLLLGTGVAGLVSTLRRKRSL